MRNCVFSIEVVLHLRNTTCFKEFSYFIDGLSAKSFNVLELVSRPDLPSVISDGCNGSEIGILLAIARVFIDLLHLFEFFADEVIGRKLMASDRQFCLSSCHLWQLTHTIFWFRYLFGRMSDRLCLIITIHLFCCL